jgi:hypothetical protein
LGLKFNVSKCSMLHLARTVSRPVRFYTSGGEVLGSVSEAKYLGITLSDNYGTRSSQWRARRNLKGSPYKLREMVYLSLVRSSLEYCGSIWDPTVKQEVDMVEVVQRRAARWARGAYGIISVTALLSEF